MPSSFRIKVNAAIVVGVAALCILGFIAFQSSEEFFKADQEVRRTQAIRDKLDVIREDMVRAEVVQLRYLFTGDPANSDEFRATTNRVRGAIGDLGEFLAAQDQKDLLGDLERVVLARFEVLTEAMRMRGSGNAVMSLLFNERVRKSDREAERIAELIDGRELQMINAQREWRQTTAELTIRIVYWTVMLSLILLLWAISIINRYERDQRRAEDALRNAQERLTIALEASGIAVWDWDLAKNEIYLSAGWLQMLGGQARESTLAPAELLELVHPDDLEPVRKMVRDALKGVIADYREEHRVRMINGEWMWILSRGRVVQTNPEGRPLRMAGTNHDVTERKRFELALREHDQQLRLITNAVPAVIAYQDASERIRFCNQKMARLLGMPPESVIGHSLRELFGEDAYLQMRPFILRALAGDDVHFERMHATPQGQVDLSVSYVPRRNGRGDVEGFYTLAADVTDLKRLDRMKSEFVSTVSHELRTPLTSIRGSLGVLAAGIAGPLPDKARSFIEIAKNNCERLIRLINDILDMEKIESGKMSFQLRVFDLMELVEQVVKANEGFAAQSKVRLQVRAALTGARVHADSDRLAQVLTNFISNACKFSPADSTVEVTMSTDGERVRVGVSDQGPGISEEFQKRIFQKFSQADSSDVRKQGGSGLGLSISKAIVEGLGGEIGFATEAEKGTTFYFLLPEWHEPGVLGPSEGAAWRN